MGIFSAPSIPTPPPPPPIPPAANPPIYASGATYASQAAARLRGGKPMAGTDLTGGQGAAKADTTDPELVSGLDKKAVASLAGNT